MFELWMVSSYYLKILFKRNIAIDFLIDNAFLHNSTTIRNLTIQATTYKLNRGKYIGDVPYITYQWIMSLEFSMDGAMVSLYPNHDQHDNFSSEISWGFYSDFFLLLAI